VRVAGQRLADGLAGVGVPQPHGLVKAAGGDALAVGAERQTPYSRRCFGDLECVDPLYQRSEQWAFVRRLRKLLSHEQLFESAHITTWTVSGQHRLRLGDNAKTGCLTEPRVGLV